MARASLLLLLAAVGCAADPPRTDAGSAAVDSGAVDSGAPLADAPVVDTWSSFATGFFATYCIECHSGPPSGRDFRTITEVIRDAPIIRCGVAPASEPSAGCTAADPDPAMFPIGDGPFPSDEERRRIVAWIEAGLPE